MFSKITIGKIGEDLATDFLIRKGYKVIQRNYWQPWGEIDIIVKKKNIIHFVEVKTVSCENVRTISCETESKNPEENIHQWKVKRLSRAIQTYLLDRHVSHETNWQFDTIAVFLDLKNREAKVRFCENVIL